MGTEVSDGWRKLELRSTPCCLAAQCCSRHAATNSWRALIPRPRPRLEKGISTLEIALGRPNGADL